MKLPRFDEEAVSPVIGVILMVAIVVILAAVVWVAVAPMADENLQSTKIVKLTVSPNRGQEYCEVVASGGAGLSQLTRLNYTVDGVDNGSLWTDAPDIGNITIAYGVAKGDRFMLIGEFTDGSTQILYDKTI